MADYVLTFDGKTGKYTGTVDGAEPTPKQTDYPWGLFDTKTNTWMGNDKGPITHTSFLLARVAAQTIDVMLRQEPGRTVARPMVVTPNRIVEDVKPSMTPLEALKYQEDGGL
jgi:hypothetical protein